ncbi:MAG: trypsin-like peptidase domain-containing protein [Anaerolineales bacterium]|nr:trypsin-like peptidase domain-containing protein [Anaerolineales bacterium]
MKNLRKVINNLIVFMCFSMMLTVPGCDARSAEVLLSAKKEIDHSYLSYKVKNESAKTYAERVSRNSAVQVRIEYSQASIRGSGTYFKYKGHNMVVTAAHLYALGGAKVLKSEALIVTPQEKVIGTLVYIDSISDIAIFKVPSLESRKAAKFKRTQSYEIGSDVVYSGFPGANSLLTIPGKLSGDGFGTDIAMHSFAWGGSSGSGVFDEDGRFVGVVVSIMVGRGFIGPQLVGSVVYVAPANLIDSVYLRQNLDKLEATKNAGF